MTDFPLARELEEAADRMTKLVERISDPARGETVCDSPYEALSILAATAYQYRREATLQLRVDGVDRETFEQIDARELPWGLGRRGKTVVLARGVSILYVLDESEPVEVSPSNYSVRAEPSLMESLAIADQHDLQREMKW